MKRLIKMTAALLLAASCGQNKAPKVLVLYYSQNGATRAVAEQFQQRLGADIQEILPLEPYDGDFQATLDRSKVELEESIFPEVQAIDIKDYDVVFLGYPVWFGTCANPVLTVLHHEDFSGKKVVPFCTFGSGGLESSSATIATLQPQADVLPGYGVRAARLDAAGREIERFLIEQAFIEGEAPAIEPFPASHEVSDEEAAIFDEAVGDYPMISAVAREVSARAVPEGTEYMFSAENLPREGMPAVFSNMMTVYVLAEEGKAPVFTKVVR